MTGREMYLQLYDSLPEEVKQAMRDLWDTGVNDSGVWVRFRDVEATVGKIVLALRKEALVYNGSESLKEVE